MRFARALRDVAVREPVIRSSADLPAQLREMLDNIPIGRLTPPEVTTQGVEVFALCGKKQTHRRHARRSARSATRSDAGEIPGPGEAYLKEMRSGAMIEYR